MFRFGCGLLFGVGEDSLGRWGAYGGASVEFNGFDLRERLFFWLAHSFSFKLLTAVLFGFLVADVRFGSP